MCVVNIYRPSKWPPWLVILAAAGSTATLAIKRTQTRLIIVQSWWRFKCFFLGGKLESSSQQNLSYYFNKSISAKFFCMRNPCSQNTPKVIICHEWLQLNASGKWQRYGGRQQADRLAGSGPDVFLSPFWSVASSNFHFNQAEAPPGRHPVPGPGWEEPGLVAATGG